MSWMAKVYLTDVTDNVVPGYVHPTANPSTSEAHPRGHSANPMFAYHVRCNVVTHDQFEANDTRVTIKELTLRRATSVRTLFTVSFSIHHQNSKTMTPPLTVGYVSPTSPEGPAPRCLSTLSWSDMGKGKEW